MSETTYLEAKRILDPLPEPPGDKGVTHCCDMMSGEVDRTCWHHDDVWDCPDFLIYYAAKFNEYGIPIRDGGSSYWIITHCPWCGTALPASRRTEWNEHIARLDIDIWTEDSERLPAEYLDAGWWNKAP